MVNRDGGATCDNCGQRFVSSVVRDHNLYCSVGCEQKAMYCRVQQVSVLSAEDRETIDEARRWFRRILLAMQDDNLPGMGDPRRYSSVVLDGKEREGIYATLEKLSLLLARHAGEPQLTEGKR